MIAMATVLQGNQTLQRVDLSRPLLPSKMEESTIHISRMLQVNSIIMNYIHCVVHTTYSAMGNPYFIVCNPYCVVQLRCIPITQCNSTLQCAICTTIDVAGQQYSEGIVSFQT